MFTGHFTDIPQAIQLALAPVFLLTGIAGLLNIMTGRLARIIDRGRKLVEQPLPERKEVPRHVAGTIGAVHGQQAHCGSHQKPCPPSGTSPAQ